MSSPTLQPALGTVFVAGLLHLLVTGLNVTYSCNGPLGRDEVPLVGGSSAMRAKSRTCAATGGPHSAAVQFAGAS